MGTVDEKYDIRKHTFALAFIGEDLQAILNVLERSDMDWEDAVPDIEKSVKRAQQFLQTMQDVMASEHPEYEGPSK